MVEKKDFEINKNRIKTIIHSSLFLKKLGTFLHLILCYNNDNPELWTQFSSVLR